MALIEKYKGFEIWESDRHGKAVKGTKKSNSIQVRDYNKTQPDSYLLVKQISFKIGELANRNNAIVKAKTFVDGVVSNAL